MAISRSEKPDDSRSPSTAAWGNPSLIAALMSSSECTVRPTPSSPPSSPTTAVSSFTIMSSRITPLVVKSNPNGTAAYKPESILVADGQLLCTELLSRYKSGTTETPGLRYAVLQLATETPASSATSTLTRHLNSKAAYTLALHRTLMLQKPFSNAQRKCCYQGLCTGPNSSN